MKPWKLAIATQLTAILSFSGMAGAEETDPEFDLHSCLRDAVPEDNDGCYYYSGGVVYDYGGLRIRVRACGYTPSECWRTTREIRRNVRACFAAAGLEANVRNFVRNCRPYGD